ncbi:acyl transferase/acyl hydrolase/lysophospholipase [Microdochium trichocladiopsis]|uniref:Acyl transferase/acyl hydrolase/lysophospholipase n=1 Tax=Microdochium trichocladiopsis TaxID=1682393 RepID=A0A9P9BUW6_9PEZI|nr:acyl transferase/acyl hydrolase/lysophospholipase [Microdochium trichocladiopsis]KAH7032712.1 acyl transferase/acyl hydrolase/lysophospholipase [Microdochium trichocladiopsis]
MARLDTPPPEGGEIPLTESDGTRTRRWITSVSTRRDAKLQPVFDKPDNSESETHQDPITPPGSTSPWIDNDVEFIALLRRALRDCDQRCHSIGSTNSETEVSCQQAALRTLMTEIDDDLLLNRDIRTVTSTLSIPDEEKANIVQLYCNAWRATNVDIAAQHDAMVPMGAHEGQPHDTASTCAVFGGQGLRCDCLQELRDMARNYATLVEDLLRDSSRLLAGLSATDATTRQYFRQGFDVASWLEHPEQAPDDQYLRAAPVSAPLIGLVQLTRYAIACKTLGVTPGQFCAQLSATTGHSQGIITAAAIASATDWPSYHQAMQTALTTLFWIGMRTQQVWNSAGGCSPVSAAMQQDALDHDERAPSPMLNIKGLTRAALQECLHATNRYLGTPRTGGDKDQAAPGLKICMVNGPRHFVVSGRPHHLYGLNLQIRKVKRLQAHGEARGQAGNTLAITSKFLDVSVPFHSTAVAAAVALVLRDIENLHLLRAALRIPVIGPEEAADLRASPYDGANNVLPQLVKLVVSKTVDWDMTLQVTRQQSAMSAPKQQDESTLMLDFGPGGVHGISSLLKGSTASNALGAHNYTGLEDDEAIAQQGMTAFIVGAWSDGKP